MFSRAISALWFFGHAIAASMTQHEPRGKQNPERYFSSIYPGAHRTYDSGMKVTITGYKSDGAVAYRLSEDITGEVQTDELSRGHFFGTCLKLSDSHGVCILVGGRIEIEVFHA